MEIAPYIDHTILQATTTGKAIDNLCTEAIEHQFAAVCVPPYFIAKAKQQLLHTNVKLATVIGFPLGYSAIPAKLAAVNHAIAMGADEIDMVVNIAALKEGDFEYLSSEIRQVLQPIRLHRKIIKVIIESGILIDNEIIRCCELYAKHRVDFLKTSTGMGAQGATVEQVALMRAHLPEEIKIKASGGIRNFAFAKELIEAGATRIGTSTGVAIVAEAKAQDIKMGGH